MKKSTAFILWLIGFLAGVVVGVLAAMKIMLEEDDDEYEFDGDEDGYEEFEKSDENEAAAETN